MQTWLLFNLFWYQEAKNKKKELKNEEEAKSLNNVKSRLLLKSSGIKRQINNKLVTI